MTMEYYVKKNCNKTYFFVQQHCECYDKFHDSFKQNKYRLNPNPNPNPNS